MASSAQDRVSLLCLRDDALGMLRRQDQRVEGLAELGALAEALADSHLALQVRLRRAAAFRLAHDEDGAAEISRQVRQSAADLGDETAELAACLELGQDLLRTELGAGYVQTPREADLDGAEEAYKRAAALAERLHDDSRLAAASRELGTISVSRISIWFISAIEAGQHVQLLQRIASGVHLGDMVRTLPVVRPLMAEAKVSSERWNIGAWETQAYGTIIGMALAASLRFTLAQPNGSRIRRLMIRMKF